MKVSTLSSYAAALLLASAAANEVSTPAPTTTAPYYDEVLGCWPVSIEHDATYCIGGPICSGFGPSPAGSLCPVKGDAAIADCHSYLSSFMGGENCVLPVDATCQVIKTGAWGCVISGSNPTPAPTKYEDSIPTRAPAKYGNNGGNGGHGNGENGGNSGGNGGNGSNGGLPPNGNPGNDSSASWVNDSSAIGILTEVAGTEAASAGGVSVGVISAIAAVAAAVAAIAGVAIYRQHVKKVELEESTVMVDIVTP